MNRLENDAEAAANYIERLQQSDRAAAQNNFKRISSVEKRTTGRGGTEVKISFGPSRPPGSAGKSKNRNNGSNNNCSSSNNNNNISSSHSSSAAAASMAAMMGGGGSCGSVSFGDLDLEALKEKAAAAAAGQKNLSKQTRPSMHRGGNESTHEHVCRDYGNVHE